MGNVLLLKSEELTAAPITPQATVGSTEAVVTIQTSPNINFTAEIIPVPNSGGHQHNGNKPTGRFKETVALPYNVYSGQTDENGQMILTYISGPAGGEEVITVRNTDEGKEGREFVFVRVVGLAPLETNATFYLYTSNDQHHPNFLYGTPNFLNQIKELAEVYLSSTNIYLSFNDMSLISGGIFDIRHNWLPDHNSHRKGTSVDINRNTVNLGAKSVTLDLVKLDETIKILTGQNRINCCRIEEGKSIHIECPKPQNVAQCTDSTR